MTVLGACAVSPVLRSGAQVGDVVALCGRQGWAAGGLAVLGRGFRSPRVLVDAYRRPQPPYDAGAAAAEAGATAMIDVSDGLLADAAHVARASGVGIDITPATLDVPEPLVAVGSATGADPLPSSSAAATTTRCSRRSPPTPRCPRAGCGSAPSPSPAPTAPA